VTRRLAVLIGGSLAFWAALALPAAVWAEGPVLLYSGVALGLCLVPGVAVVLASGLAFRGSPENQVLVALGGTAVRMFLVLGAGLALYLGMPGFHQPAFWFWVLLFYLFTLALEVVVMVTGRPMDRSRHENLPASGRV
jgi:hypothetical protein